MNPSEKLQAALQAVHDRTDELAELNQMAADATARKLSLETTCDLSDEKALAEIARLQVLDSLLPRRIDHRTDALTEAEKSLLSACHAFIHQDLGPRTRRMVKRAKDKARESLAPLFSDTVALEKAVEKTALVTELQGFTYYATIHTDPPGGLLAYAERLLQTWADCDAHEAKLATTAA
jgi:hypothetical protein